MNIVFATDNNFVQHCCAAMTSVLYNNKNVTIYILTEGLSENNVSLLKRQAEKFNSELYVKTVDSSIISKLPMPKAAAQHISPATYYRLFVEEILPDNVDKIIYLDCDVIVRSSLLPLWNIDIEGLPLAAVYQNNSWATNKYKVKMSAYERLNMVDAKGYFNAGVLLINVKYWREINARMLLLDFMRNHYERIVHHDQDILNGCFYRDVVSISDIWNCRLPIKKGFYGEAFLDKRKIRKIKSDAVIVHYVNRPKPWEFACNNPYVSEYFRYLDMTPFAGWRPAVKWSNIYTFRIRPILVNIKHFFDRVFSTGIYSKQYK